MMSTTYFVVIHHTHLGLACNVYIGTPLTTRDFVYVKGTDFSIVKIVKFSEEIAWFFWYEGVRIVLVGK